MNMNATEIKGDLENPLIIDDMAKEFLKITVKWTQFLAVLGFIASGIAFVACILMFFVMLFVFNTQNLSDEAYNALGNMPRGFVLCIYLLGAIVYAIYFIPITYLYKFSVRIKTALFQNNNLLLTDGFRYLKSHFRFVGIFTIIMIALYIIFLIGFILFAMSESFNHF